MEITLPNRFHGHQHRSLHNPIPQAWDTKRPQLAVRLRNVNAPRGLRLVGARKQFSTYRRKLSVKVSLHHRLVDSIDARRSRTL